MNAIRFQATIDVVELGKRLNNGGHFRNTERSTIVSVNNSILFGSLPSKLEEILFFSFSSS